MPRRAGNRCECGRVNAIFGLPGGKGFKDALWCARCPGRPEGAVDVVTKRCECGRATAYLGLHGRKGDRRWCAQCKPEDAVLNRQPQIKRSARAQSELRRAKPLPTPPADNTPTGRRLELEQWMADNEKWLSMFPEPQDEGSQSAGSSSASGSSGSDCSDAEGEEAAPAPEGAVPEAVITCPAALRRPRTPRGRPTAPGPAAARAAAAGAGAKRRAGEREGAPAGAAAAATESGRVCECRRAKAQFGLPSGEGGKRWCSQCPGRPEGAVNLLAKRCECGQGYAFYLLPSGGGGRRWCAQCRPGDAVLPKVFSAVKRKDRARERMNVRVQSALRPGRPRGAVNTWAGAGEGLTAAAAAAVARARLASARARRFEAGLAKGKVDKKCECGRALPSFGLPGGKGLKDRLWCARCRPEGAVDLIGKRCECGRAIAYLGLPGGKGGRRWCAQCRPAVDSKEPSSTRERMNARVQSALRPAAQGGEGEGEGEGLAAARAQSTQARRGAAGAERVIPSAASRRAYECECGRARATFGLPGGEGNQDALWCARCPGRPQGAVDVVSKMCECGRGQAYLPDGEGGRRWCTQCRPENAVDTRPSLSTCERMNARVQSARCRPNKRCECGRVRASIGLPSGEGGVRWCARCPEKPEGAVHEQSKRFLAALQLRRASGSTPRGPAGRPTAPGPAAARAAVAPALQSRGSAPAPGAGAKRRAGEREGAPSGAAAAALAAAATAKAAADRAVAAALAAVTKANEAAATAAAVVAAAGGAGPAAPPAVALASALPASFIGRRVMRYFVDPAAPAAPPRPYAGEVTAVEVRALWHVVYEDEDEEDLDEEELESALLVPKFEDDVLEVRGPKRVRL